MKYQLIISCLFDTSEPLEDIMDKLEDFKEDMIVIHPLSPNQEVSQIRVIENHHDEDPHGPCVVIFEWDNAPVPPP